MSIKKYDIVVVGAGIAGASCAFFLTQRGLSVLVVERSGIASTGGSFAAGAFISPRVGKGSPLQNLTNEAFLFSTNFYLEKFPKFFEQTGVIRIPKDSIDAKKFIEYDRFNSIRREWIDSNGFKAYNIREKNSSFLFDMGGVCDAPKLCNEMLRGVDYKQYRVDSLIYRDNYWHIDNIRAKKVVLAKGYENSIFDMRYMGIRGIWGSRGDYESSLNLKVSMHKKISISANRDGIIKIGATHIKSKEPCIECNGRPLKGLEEIASTMVDTSDFRLKETFCGMRSSSRDYFPVVGDIIDTKYMLKKYPKILKGAKPPIKKIDNLYICNGLGGRGFVFAPLMAKMLADYIVDGTKIDNRVNPDRLFLRWCRVKKFLFNNAKSI
jgi:tRNA 5-methylaminomethyl-2-thiouridine biosynthesis bifunctional protein